MSYIENVSIKDITLNILNAIRNLGRMPIMVRSQSTTNDTVKVSGLNSSGYVQVELSSQPTSLLAGNSGIVNENIISGLVTTLISASNKINMSATEPALQNTRINSPLRRAIS